MSITWNHVPTALVVHGVIYAILCHVFYMTHCSVSIIEVMRIDHAYYGIFLSILSIIYGQMYTFTPTRLHKSKTV